MMQEKGTLTALRLFIAQPFAQYMELTDREREAATYYVKGFSVEAEISRIMNVSAKTVYRALDSAADKISRQDGAHVTRDRLQQHVWKKMEAMRL